MTLPFRLVVCAVAYSLAGCSGAPSASVSGKITCGGKPVKGTVLVSPLGESPENTGESVNATLADDGSFSAKLKTVGKHRVVVKPSDVKYPAKPGEEYPCDLAPIEKDLKAGNNEIVIGLTDRKK